MEKRELKLIKNKDGHGTINYKICLPTKWVKFLKLDKEEKVTVLLKDNSIIIKNKEDYKMEEIIKKLKEELLNKEISLVDMDNAVQSTAETTDSLFDYESDCMEQNSCSYYIAEDKNIVVEWEIVNKEKDNLKTVVKVTDIWEN